MGFPGNVVSLEALPSYQNRNLTFPLTKVRGSVTHCSICGVTITYDDIMKILCFFDRPRDKWSGTMLIFSAQYFILICSYHGQLNGTACMCIDSWSVCARRSIHWGVQGKFATRRTILVVLRSFVRVLMHFQELFALLCVINCFAALALPGLRHPTGCC